MPLFGNHRARQGGDRTRRALGLVAFVVLAGSATIGPGAGPARADTIVVIDGRGFGHGVGMAQDGAYWMGKSGRTATEILRLFYPGTTFLKQGGVVRVPLLSIGSVTIGFPNGGTIGDRRVPAGGQVGLRSTAGGLVADVVSDAQPPATLTMRFAALRSGVAVTDASAQVDVRPGAVADTPTTTPGPVAPVQPDAAIVLTPTTTTPPPSATTPTAAEQAAPSTAPIAGVAPPSSAPVDLPSSSEPASHPNGAADATGPIGTASTTTTIVAVSKLRASAAPGGLVTIGSKRYRGTLELTASGGIRIVNELDIEDYLRGMGEIRSPDWPAATLQAQAIAARTYAFRTMATAGEVCPTQRCQVYLGAQAEYSQMDAAVAATRGKVLSYKGKLAATFYSASGGGTIATPAEAFGGNGTDLPYLTSGVYPTGDVKAWTVRMTLGEVGRRLGYPGTPASIQISAVGPSGRATEVTVDGSRGPVRLAGPKVDAALGLRSTFFTVRTEIGTLSDAPPDTGSSDSTAVDLGAQSGLLTAADPAVGSFDAATDADSDAADTTVDATTIESTGASSDTAPSPVARAPAPLRTVPSAAIEHIAAGATHRDHGMELVLGGIVATAVLASVALLRRLRCG